MKDEIIRVGQIGIRFLLEAADTSGAVAMFEFTVPVGAKVPLPHYHKQYDETIYGVEGVVTFIVEGKPVDIGGYYKPDMAKVDAVMRPSATLNAALAAAA